MPNTFLSSFLQRVLVGSEFDVRVVLDSDYDVVLGGPPPLAEAVILCVRSSTIDLQPLLDSELADVLGIHRLLRLICGTSASVSLVAFLLVLRSDGRMSWLFRQVIAEISVALGHSLVDMETSMTSNPFDVTTYFESFLDRKRPDALLSEQLLDGRGVSSSSAKSAHPEQHAKSFSILTGRGKFASAVADCRNQVMVRYKDAGEAQFSKSWHIAIALDASRIASTEYMYSVLSAVAGGKEVVMWAPPQVRHGNCADDTNTFIALRVPGPWR